MSDLRLGADWQEQQLILARLKRVELIKKRDRLNERITGLDQTIAMYTAQLTPEAKQRRKKFWEDVKRLRDEDT
jgi:hypothetical protein